MSEHTDITVYEQAVLTEMGLKSLKENVLGDDLGEFGIETDDSTFDHSFIGLSTDELLGRRGMGGGEQPPRMNGEDDTDTGTEMHNPDDDNDVEMQTIDLGDEEDEDDEVEGPKSPTMADVLKLIERHKVEIPKDETAFKGIETFDDLAGLPPKERETKLKGIQQVLTDVEQRRKGLWAAIEKVESPVTRQDPSQPGAATPMDYAFTVATTIDNHLPEAFQGVSGQQISDRLDTMIETAGLSPEDKKERLRQTMTSFQNKDGDDVDPKSLGKAYRDVLEPGSGNVMERQRFYFDTFVVAQDINKPKQEGELNAREATDIIVSKAREILDRGGKFSDIETMMKETGIPRDWWPKELLAEEKAWRKTEYALQRERLAEMYEQSKGGKGGGKDDGLKKGVDNVSDFLDFAGNEFPSQVKAIKKLMDEAPETFKALNEALGKLSAATGEIGGPMAILKLIADGKSDVKTTESKENSEKIDKALELLGGLNESVTGVLELLEKTEGVSSELGEFITSHLVPGLTLAKTGLDMVKSGKSLVQHIRGTMQTKGVGQQGDQALGRGDMEGDLAFGGMIENDMRATKKQAIGDGIDLLTNCADFAGSAAGTFGGAHGQVAQGALKVVTAGIKLGKSLIFSIDDWRQAEKAREMLEEARAGNPVARVEIFKQSNLYAKMYLCLLARDKNPLATSLLIDKGYTEDNLTTPEAIKVLRQALLDSSGQKSEEDVPESGLEAVSGKVGEFVKAVGNQLTKLYDKGKFSSTKEYNASWAYTGSVDLTEKCWDGAKKQAIDAGLYDAATGIGDALKAVEDAIGKKGGAADTIQQLYQQRQDAPAPDSKEGAKSQEILLDALTALDKARSTIMRYQPITAPLGNDGKKDANGECQPHAGMCGFLGALLDAVGRQDKTIDDAMKRSGLNDPEWKPSLTGNLLATALWKTNWSNGVTFACLPKNDSGVEKALTAFWDAADALDKAAPRDPNAISPEEAKKRREASLGVMDSFRDLTGAIESCRKQIGQVPAMQDYLMKILEAAANLNKTANGNIGGTEWQPATQLSQPLKSSEWNALVAEAQDKGYLGKKEKFEDVAKALDDLDKARTTVNNTLPSKDRMKAIMTHAGANGRLRKALQKLRQANPAKPLVTAAEQAFDTASDEQKQWKEQGANRDFRWIDSLEGKDFRSSYNSAVEGGVVPPAEKLAKELESELNKTNGRIRKVGEQAKKEDWKAARKTAVSARKHLDGAISAVDGLLRTFGYQDSNQMVQYLEKTMRRQLDDKRNDKDAEMNKSLAGVLCPETAFPATQWEPGTVKASIEKALDAAIITGDQDVPALVSTLREDLGQLSRLMDTLKQQQDNTQLQQEVAKFKRFVSQSSTKIFKRLKAMEGESDFANWKAYAKGGQKWAQDWMNASREKAN
jgi:hypothetical protein